MLDDPKKTYWLLAALKASVPFAVELTPSVAQRLRAEYPALADAERHVVSDVSYAGDEGGVLCHIVPPGGREVLVASLTHVRVSRIMPLAAMIADYQKHRVKKLRKQGKT